MSTQLSTAQSMSSLQIAELVQSRHDSVKRTIERLADQEAIRLPPMVNIEKLNNLGLPIRIKTYLFTGEQGKLDSITVVAQLSPMFTAQLVKRWQELESLVSSSDYQSLLAQNHALKTELLKSSSDYKALQVMFDGGLENWQMGQAVNLAPSTVSKKLSLMRKLGLIGERGNPTAQSAQLSLEV